MPGTLSRLTMSICGLAAGIAGCATPPTTQPAAPGKEQSVRYPVQRLTGPMAIDGRWDKPAWQGAEPLELTNFMGARPGHFPRTQARLLYDDRFLYVIFRVEDRYVRAVARRHHDPVCRDSCVEFFFTPGTDLALGYFNLEVNCGGTMLFDFQVIPRTDPVSVRAADLERIEVAHSLPRNVDCEMPDPITWTVEYRLPLDILEHYCPAVTKPAPGVTWRANFYKCADATSHPHWLTWAPVDKPTPDFHLPQFFGEIEFK